MTEDGGKMKREGGWEGGSENWKEGGKKHKREGRGVECSEQQDTQDRGREKQIESQER